MAKKRIEVEDIDKQKFEALVKLGLSNQELVEFFMTNGGQLWSWVKRTYNTRSPLVVIKKIRIEGKIEFMMKQRKLAEKNQTVSIWIGKNYYDQTDESESDKSTDYEDLNPLVALLKDDEENGNDSND